MFELTETTDDAEEDDETNYVVEMKANDIMFMIRQRFTPPTEQPILAAYGGVEKHHWTRKARELFYKTSAELRNV